MAGKVDTTLEQPTPHACCEMLAAHRTLARKRIHLDIADNAPQAQHRAERPRVVVSGQLRLV